MKNVGAKADEVELVDVQPFEDIVNTVEPDNQDRGVGESDRAGRALLVT